MQILNLPGRCRHAGQRCSPDQARLVISACLLIPLFTWPWRCFRVATAAVPDQ